MTEITAQIVPATAERWVDIIEVFEGRGYGRKCWCAFWYLPRAEFKAGWGEANRAPLERRVKSGAEPGLVAYVDGLPAGWVSVVPPTIWTG